jgi:hypothetical protein
MPELKLSVGMYGDKVKLLHSKLRHHGFDIPAAEVDRRFFGPATREAVRECQEEHGLPATGVVDKSTAAALGTAPAKGRGNVEKDVTPLVEQPMLTGARVRIEESEEESEEQPGDDKKDGFIVRGRVVSPERIGLSGLRVVAIDKNVGREMVLGEDTTNARGSYRIQYDVARLRKRGKERPDIQIKVTAGGENDRFLTTSAVRYNADRRETIDVMVPADKLQRPAEYRRVTHELAAHLGASADRRTPSDLNGQFAQLREDGERQDITYLANKTGWDARVVAMVALADQYGEQRDIRPEFFYALFRAGLPANDTVLSQIEPETVQILWNKAVNEKVIPEGLEDQIPENLEQFKAFSAERLLKAPATAGVSSLEELLGVSLGADDERKQRFAQLYYENRGNLTGFWDSVRDEFGNVTADRLQLDGKLGFLTVNNAALIERLHQIDDLHTPLDLVHNGLYRRDDWSELLSGNIAIPEEIPGEDAAEKKANYADFMANQLRLSHPTAVVAEMIDQDELPLPAGQQVKTAVYQFLSGHQGQFELGVHPVEHYLRDHDVELDGEALAQVKQLQRVYQISPSDEVMGELIDHNIDSAYAVIQYDEQEFVDNFKDTLGGETTAHLTYAKAHQVHHAVLNVATSYLVHRGAPALYALSSNPAANGEVESVEAAENTGVIAYPTLEGLFGEMDYCACEHCRSVLSPAAYLVNLLQFIDLRRYNSEGVELPPTYEKKNPSDVLLGWDDLLGRRPDIQHLQLTCENTNTVLPYIDLVNEILEYFVSNGVANNNFSLQGFQGYNIEEGISTEELLANPQFVKVIAYDQLKEEVFPLVLPFHQPLEALRRYFDHVEVPLHVAMKQLRKDDSLDVPTGASPTDYRWRYILMEQLQLSRSEHATLTDSTKPLQKLYGEDPANVTEAGLINLLSNVKSFARKVDITYEELIDITRTQFINPYSHLIPKLEKLGVDFQIIKNFVDGTLPEPDFEAMLPDDLDTTQYGGNVKTWIRENFGQIMRLIVLPDPTGSEDICGFEQLEFRYALPDFENNRLKAIEFLKLLRFIRLWKKLGWTIENTDKAITALYPSAQRPAPGDDEATVKAKLDEGFKVLILRIAHIKKVMEALQLNPKRDLVPLLALWSPIDTHGSRSLYRQMFLNLTILKLDDVFKEDGYGNYLVDSSQKIVAHEEALRAAFNLTQEELSLILQELNFDDQTPLSLENISSIFRNGYLARKLRLSIRELLALKALSGIDSFEPPDPVQPAILRFIDLTQLIKQSGFKVSQLLYFLQHVDLTGKASPTRSSVLTFAKTIRDDLLRIDREHVVVDDPTGEVARTKMALVYGSAVTDTFFGLLNESSQYSVSYSHSQPELEADIRAVTEKIAYDHFQKQLSFRGLMTDAVKTNLQNAPSATTGFKTAVKDLFDAGQAEFQSFFERFPDLKALYSNFETSNEPVQKKMSALLADFLPELRKKLKRQQVRQTVSAQVDTELSLADTLLETPGLLHAIGQPNEPAIAEFLNLETQGISVDYFFADDVAGTPDQEATAVAGINYRTDGATLPQNPAGGNATISGVWRWYLEVPDNGFYNFYIEADGGAEVTLTLEGEPVALNLQNGVWQNQNAIELKAGQLYAMQLTVKKVKDKLVLKWESKGLARESIPAAYLYPALLVDRFVTGYIRLLKALTIAEELELSAMEMKHFGAHLDYYISGEEWLNALPVAPSSDAATTHSLLAGFTALLRYAQLKVDLEIQDDSLIQLFKNPVATTEDDGSLLGRVTGWEEADLSALLGRFGLAVTDLTHLHQFIRVNKAFSIVKKLGIQASTLLDSTTNEPTADTVRDLQGALRARYEDSAWLKVLQPINDELRSRQRDALVAFILHKLQQAEATRHIDTPDKLFEYFLIDVEMDPCMQTSRIKQAISSVLLFIQRCLLNLEPEVAASSIKAKEWEWMKRYRVWEANRKVFLFPENWLEPELRHDKSPFFRDLESELLQADITDDVAATALVHYLEKLDEVAKLEICGMYYAENEIDNVADDIVHVIGRTAGTRRTYYYRRLEHSYWTPWEKVDLNIEDNPVLPVVWRGRLFLFWLSVMQEALTVQKARAGSINKKLTELEASELLPKGDAKVRVNVNLYWSEYYNGKWQPPKTSDVNQPISFGEFPPAGDGAFDRAKLTLANDFSPDVLYIFVYYPGQPDQYRFELYNTHSLPVIGAPGTEVGAITRGRSFSKEGPLLVATYHEPFSEGFSREVLSKVELYDVVEPRHGVKDIFEAPFFFQDRRHAFFVRSVESTVSVAESGDIGIQLEVAKIETPVVPPIIIEPGPDDLELQEEIVFSPVVIQPGVVDPSPVESFLNQDVYIDQIMGTVGTVQYGDRLIGPGGSFVPERTEPIG